MRKEENILFAGTLIPYTATNVPVGHVTFEQFVLFTNVYGTYNNHSKLENNQSFQQYELLPYVKFGLVKNIDFNLITNVVYSHSKGGDRVSVGDTLVLFGFQLMTAEKDSWKPDLRLLAGESFPTGKYDELDPEMGGADGVGSGAFETTFVLSAAKVFYVSKNHAFRLDPNLYFILPTAIDIKDRSVYGGIEGTRGTIDSPVRFAIDFPFEFNFTNHWIFGMDIFYLYRNAAPFYSKNAIKPFEKVPSGENLSLAPCIEYNPSEKFGIEGGVWFSVSGRNSLAFTTSVVVAWWYF